MKKLIIVRHSKSSWKDFSLSDFNRPLNKRGKTDGPIMSKYLSKQIKKWLKIRKMRFELKKLS